MSDALVSTSPDSSERPLTPGEESALSVSAGLRSDAPSNIRASAGVGKMAAIIGSLNYAAGNEVATIEITKQARQMQLDILELNRAKMKPAEIGEALERIGQFGETISRANANLLKALAQEVAAKNTKARTKSFSPDQVIVPVQVNVNGIEQTTKAA